MIISCTHNPMFDLVVLLYRGITCIKMQVRPGHKGFVRDSYFKERKSRLFDIQEIPFASLMLVGNRRCITEKMKGSGVAVDRYM